MSAEATHAINYEELFASIDEMDVESFLAFITPPVLLLAAQHHDLAPVAGERIALTLAGGLLVAVVTIAGSAVLDRVRGESVK